MVKADDSSLDSQQLRAVEAHAKHLLNEASGWGRFPTPVSDILAAANLRVAPSGGVFDARRILAFLQDKAEHVATSLRSAIAKCLGICDVEDEIIHIDHSVHPTKQTFLKLHEAGHHQIPWHRKLFRIFPDCDKTLHPEVSNLFEREANNFARYVLFQGDGFSKLAADSNLSIRSPMDLAKRFGASVYASCREFARTNHRACAIYILEQIEFGAPFGAKADVRRIEVSPSYFKRFGVPQDQVITLDHPIGSALPIGRRSTKPRTTLLPDRNGKMLECVMEAFDTTFNVIILIYPIKSLESNSITK